MIAQEFIRYTRQKQRNWIDGDYESSASDPKSQVPAKGNAIMTDLPDGC